MPKKDYGGEMGEYIEAATGMPRQEADALAAEVGFGDVFIEDITTPEARIPEPTTEAGISMRNLAASARLSRTEAQGAKSTIRAREKKK